MRPPVPKKYQPKGYEILYEDRDLLVGNKGAGFVTVPTKWDRGTNLHDVLNHYVRKGNARSRACVYVVHRLDQATTGVLIFAKTEAVQNFLKNHWPETIKTYFTIVHGHLKQKSGTISSYLQEDDDYHVHSNQNEMGRLAQTQYEVLKENAKFSLLKINLLTGRKNQIRVHLSDLGHPLVGDNKYGDPKTPYKSLALHAYSIAFTHPHTRDRMMFEAKTPDFFQSLVTYRF